MLHGYVYYRRRGNMLAMVALIGLVIIAVLLVGFFCQFLFLSHQKERTDADECALSFAHLLNERDRIGQMNTVVERSRELVHASRLAHDDLKRDESDPALEDFSRLLVEEARTGAHLVESSRQILCETVKQDVIQESKRYKEKLTAKTEAKVGLMRVSPVNLTSVEGGAPRGVMANVIATKAFEELLKHDRQNGYVSQSGLAYVGDINAKLPSPDNDLDFRLTPLASPIGAGMSPARLTANNILDAKPESARDGDRRTGGLQIPSAVRVKMEVPVAAQGMPTLNSKMQVAASAAAGGAMQAPDELDGLHKSE